MINIFVSLSEGDKRLIVALLLVFVLVFVLIAFLGSVVVRVMKYQGKQLDNLCYDVIKTRVVTNKKQFTKYARRKNWNQFYKEAMPPLLILVFSGLVLLVTCLIRKDFNYDIFNHDDTGFATILFLWDFSDCKTTFFGLTIINKWPTNFVNQPHFEVDAIGSYLFVPTFLVGAIWYLITVQKLMARTVRMYRLSHTIFKKSLDNFNLADEQDKDIQAAIDALYHEEEKAPTEVEVISKSNNNEDKNINV